MVGSGAALNDETEADEYAQKELAGGRCRPSDGVFLTVGVILVLSEGVMIRLATHAAIPRVTKLARFFMGVRSTRRRMKNTSREHTICMTHRVAIRSGA